MKEISEEYQWKIFDLLEGNLSEKESTLLINEIQNDADLNHYYETLKLTYLEPQEIQYPKKELLLKKSSFAIVNLNFYKYAAAAIVIIVGGYFVISQKITSPNSVFTREISKIEPIKSKDKVASEIPKGVYLSHSINQIEKTSLIQAPLKSLKPFNTKNFNPSTKLIDENQFLNQLVANEYLNSSEKKQMMLKWLLLNTKNHMINTSENNHETSIHTEVKLVEQPLLSAEELESEELNEIWVQEAKQMLKKGQLPKIKLVTTKSQSKWLPTVGFEIQTETASMVNHIFN